MFGFQKLKVSDELRQHLKVKNDRYTEKCISENPMKKEKCILYGNNFRSVSFSDK